MTKPLMDFVLKLKKNEVKEKVSKFCNLSRGRPEGSLLISYYTEV